MARFSHLVEESRSLLLICIRLSNINVNNTHIFPILSKELASLTRTLTKEAAVVKTETKPYDQVINSFIVTTTSIVQTQLVEILKLSKSVMSNPGSYLGREEVSKQLELICKSLLHLITNIFLGKKSRNDSLSKETVAILSTAQNITEYAQKLQRDNKPKVIAGFSNAMKEFIELSRSIIRHVSQDELIQASDIFSVSNKRKRRGTDITGTSNNISNFQVQARRQLVSALEEVIVVTILHSYRKQIKRLRKRSNAGLSKQIFDCFQYFQLMENEIIANETIKRMKKSLPGFRTLWAESSPDLQATTSEIITKSIPVHDRLKFFNIDTKVNIVESKKILKKQTTEEDLKQKEESSSVEEDKPETNDKQTENKRLPSKIIIPDDLKSISLDHSSTHIQHRQKKVSKSGRAREKRSSIATLSTKKFRTFLKRKPSILDSMVENSLSNQTENERQLNHITEMYSYGKDVHELDIDGKLLPEPAIKIIENTGDVPALITNFHSSVLLISGICEIITEQALAKNLNEAQKLFGILAQCNVWLSSTRIEKLPPSKIEKVEVQLVQQNYVELSKTLEISPTTSILVGCAKDGWFSVKNLVLRKLREYKYLMCALATQIASLFTSFRRIDIEKSQPLFFYIESCIQRFIDVLNEFLVAQENYALVSEDGNTETSSMQNITINLWEEAKTRNKFDIESPKTLTKGTENSLIEALTDISVVDNDFNTDFFATYRSFMSPRLLLSKLFERYDVPKEFERQAGRIKFRVLVALREMMRYCPDDFDDVMLAQVKEFVSDESNFEGPNVNMAKSLELDVNQSIEKRTKPDVVPVIDTLTPMKVRENISFLNFDTTKLAQMITLIDSSLFSRIQPFELLQNAWSTSKFNHRSVNTIQLIQRLNRFTIWVASQIVWPSSLKQRIEVMEKFLTVGKLLLKYNNFHSLMGIYAAFEISAVVRLKFTYAGVKKKLKIFLDEVKELFDQSYSWKNYREKVKETPPPSVPYLGITLTDLVYIEDGNKTLLDDGRINFGKQRLVAKVINSVLQYQNPPHEFPISPVEFIFTRELPFMAETPLYSLSLKREPRNSSLKDIEQ